MNGAASGLVAIGYGRVGDARARSEVAVAGQRATIEAWAALHGVDLAAWRVDIDVPGDLPLAERPGLVAALAAVRTHGAGMLVAATTDRFATDIVVSDIIQRAALMHGATLRSAADSPSSPSGEQSFTRGALDLARAYERAVIRARTRSALAAKKLRGERTGAVPFGYRLAADGIHLEVEEAEQAVIATVRELAGAGLSQRAIVVALGARGVTGRTGSPLQQTQVARLLRTARAPHPSSVNQGAAGSEGWASKNRRYDASSASSAIVESARFQARAVGVRAR